MPVTQGTTNLKLQGTFLLNFGSTSNTIQLQIGGNRNFAVGTAAGQYDQQYIFSRSVVSGTPDVFDVNAGILTQPDGTPFSVVDIVAIHIVNKSPTSTLTVGGGTGAVPSIGFVVKPLGENAAMSYAKPAYAVTASTGDKIQVVADTGTAAYDVHIFGRSA